MAKRGSDGQMTFPILFDLDGAVQQAGDAWDNKYASALEKRIGKRPIGVKLRFNPKDFEKFDEVKKKLAEIKVDPLSTASKNSIKELTKDLQSLAKALENLNNFKGIKRAEADSVQLTNLQIQQERLRLAQERLRISQERLTMSQLRGEQQALRTSKAYGQQETYVSRLLKRMSVYASFSAIVGFAKNLQEVTAQFELQQVSLGAILQDMDKATLLFGKLKAQALESPATLMDLTKYTKQLAAYKIEYEDLFDTTKRLTDVAMGLGVSMDRVILAYGQTRAVGALRSSEIRQYTEMGIPIAEELAKKLTLVNGELVTAGEVMKMVEERMISFDLVKQVFEDMTSEGGNFFNMQEKQADTLFGLYAKLGDAYQIMLNKIGEGGLVNSALKGIAKAAIYLMENVDALARTLAVTGGALAIYKLGWVKISAIYKSASSIYTAALARQVTATTGLQRAQNMLKAQTVALTNAENKLTLAKASGIQKDIQAAESALALAKSRHTLAVQTQKNAEKELTAANKALSSAPKSGWGAVFKSIGKTLFSTVGWGIAVGGVTMLFNYFVKLYDNATRLNRELKKIQENTKQTAEESAANFKRLADQITRATDGSFEQRKALEELQRTYGDILPAQTLQIDTLKNMKGAYDDLTRAIEENAYMQGKAKALSEVETEYADDIKKAKELTEKALDAMQIKNIDGSTGSLTAAQSQRMVDYITSEVRKGERDIHNVFTNALKREGFGKDAISSFFTAYNAQPQASDVKKLETWLRTYAGSIDRVNSTYKQGVGNIGKYTDALNAAKDAASRLETPLEKAQELLKPLLQESGLGQDFIKGFKDSVDFMGADFWNAIQDKIGNSSALNALRDATKKELEKIFPAKSDFKRVADRIADDVNEALSLSVKRLNALDTETERDYVKRLTEEKEKLQDAIKESTTVKGGGLSIEADKARKKAEDEIKWIDNVLARLNKYDKDKSGGSSQQDPWIVMLQNRIKFMQDFQKTVAEYNKSMVYEDALLSAQTEMFQRGAEFGFKVFDLEGTENELINYYEAFITEIKGKLEALNLDEFKELGEVSVLSILNTDTASKEAMAYIKLLAQVHKEHTDFMRKTQTEELRKALSKIAEEVSRSKEAKEFYDKILGQTGDVEVAQKLTASVYGVSDGGKIAAELYAKQKAEIEAVFKSKEASEPIILTGVFDDTNMRIDYKRLLKIYDEYSEQILEGSRSTAEKIATEGAKSAQAQILDMVKVLNKAKDFEQRRVDITKKAMEERRAIIRSGMEQSMKDAMLTANREQERKDLADLEVEEFKSSEGYVRVFQDMDNATTATLEHLRGEIGKLMSSMKDMSPANMKAMAKAAEDIDKAIEGRGFGRALAEGVKDYAAATKELKAARVAVAQAEAEHASKRDGLRDAITAAEAQQAQAEAEAETKKNTLDTLIAQGAAEAEITAAENEYVAACLAAEDAKAAVRTATEAQAKAEDEVTTAINKQNTLQDKQRKAYNKIVKGIDAMGKGANDLANTLADIKDLLGVAEDSAAGIAFDSAIQGLQDMAKAVGLVTTAMNMVNFLAQKGNVYVAVASALMAVISMAVSYEKNLRIAAANEEIERQSKLLKQLEYAYGRLEEQANKTFGGEWIANYNAQLRILQAQATAYWKQVKAERSKGKEADEEAIGDMLDSYREAMDEISAMEGKVAEKMLGTDLASAARDFANAWLEAWLEFGNTADAIEGKFHDMVKNMVVEGALAAVMKHALEPVFKLIDGMSGADMYNKVFWDKFAKQAKESTEAANQGAQLLMQSLSEAGLDLRSNIGELRGIAKNVGTASSEEINALAAGINTQNFYMSYVPQIYTLLQQMQQGRGASNSVDTTLLQAQAMQHYAQIEVNTAATVRELQGLATMLSRVITYKGNKYGVNTHI